MILGWIPYLKEKSTMKNWLITVANTDIIYLLVFLMFYWLHIYWSWLSPVLFLLHACMHTQSFPTLCNPMDCSLPGCSVYGIFQARILEWVANSFSRGSSWPWDGTCISCVSCTGRQVLTSWATGEAWNLLPYCKYVRNYFCSSGKKKIEVVRGEGKSYMQSTLKGKERRKT